MKSILTLSILGISLVGCSLGGGEITTLANVSSPAEIPAGWNIWGGTNFTFAAPPEWGIPNDFGMSPEMLENLGSAGVATGVVPEQEDSYDKANIHIVDLGQKPIPGEPRCGVVVKHTTVSGGTNLKKQANEFFGDGTKDSTERQEIELSFGKCEVYRKTREQITGDTFYQISYVVVDNEDVWTFQFDQANNNNTIESFSQEIVNSFRRL